MSDTYLRNVLQALTHLNKKVIRISIAYHPLETCLGGGGRGGGGSLVPTLSTRYATGGGGGERGEGVQSQILSKILAGYISLIKCVIAFKFSQCVGHTEDSLYAESQSPQLYMLEVMVIYGIFTNVALTSKILAFGLSNLAYR